MADLAYAEIRLAVAIRADYLCEYCLIGEDDTFFGCQIDHIISRKHGGETALTTWPTLALSVIGIKVAILVLSLKRAVR